MFKRIKNLLELSKYTVQQDNEITSGGLIVHPPKLVNTMPPKKKLATIVDMDAYNPLNEFTDETIK